MRAPRTPVVCNSAREKWRVIAAHVDRQTFDEFRLLARAMGETNSSLLRKLILAELAAQTMIDDLPLGVPRPYSGRMRGVSGV